MTIKHENLRCKGVHIKLDRETHARFKSALVFQGVTMQDAVEEFARLIGDGHPAAVNMLVRMVRDRVKEELATVGLTPLPRRKHINELDPERLYDLINDVDDDVGELSTNRRGCNEAA